MNVTQRHTLVYIIYTRKKFSFGNILIYVLKYKNQSKLLRKK